MKNFYFTFGTNSVLQNYYQLIVAKNLEQATKKMVKHWGNNWAFGYEKQEFAEGMKQGYFKDLKALNPLYAVELITVGEGLALTKRFENIKGAARCYKLERLEKLLEDIANSFDIFSDEVAKYIYLEVEKEITFTEMKAMK